MGANWVDDVGGPSRGRERNRNGHSGGRRDGRDEGGRLYDPTNGMRT